MTPPEIHYECVTVTASRRAIVDLVTFTAPAGVVTALIGPNGSGKSTLLSLLAGSRARRQGAVLIDGREIETLRGAHRADQIGVLAQHAAHQSSLTASEMVEIGLRAGSLLRRGTAADSRVAVASALDAVGIGALGSHLMAELSGGERQRVMLAQALVRNPTVLVLDEPTNHLDIGHQHELLAMVAESGRTVIAALHTLDAVSTYAGHVVMLDHGRVVGAGAPREVLNEEAVDAVFGVRSMFVDTSFGSQLVTARRLPDHKRSARDQA